MTTYAAILRGINVSGQKHVDMAALEKLFVALGHSDVSTYIRSGNVVFTASSGASSDLAQELEAQIMLELGLEVTVLLRTKAELARVLERNPYIPAGVDRATLHVTFLAEHPDRALLAKLVARGFEPDGFKVHGREVYLHCPGGYGRTKLNNAFWERRLGVAASTRNWKTVTRLGELVGI